MSVGKIFSTALLKLAVSVQINKSFERLEKPGDRKTQSRTTIVIFFRCGETEISAFNSRLMCAARLDLFFFYVLPLLTPGGIINPPPKTACRDQAHFRRDSVKISTRLHFSVRVHFFPLYFSCFLFCFFLLPGRMYTYRYKIKYSRTVSRADASSLVCAKFLFRFGTPRYYSSLIEIFETGIAAAFVRRCFMKLAIQSWLYNFRLIYRVHEMLANEMEYLEGRLFTLSFLSSFLSIFFLFLITTKSWHKKEAIDPWSLEPEL